MKINNLIMLIILLSLILIYTCREPSSSNGVSLSINFVSVQNGDSLNPGAGILIRFSEALDLNSFNAQDIRTSADISDVDSSGPQTFTINFQVYQVQFAENILLNGSPLTFWYDPAHSEMALFEETTIQMPFGTGEGFQISQDSVELTIKADISAENGGRLGEDYKLILHRATSQYQFRAFPNPAYLGFNTQGLQYPRVNFFHLPAFCLIHIYDHTQTLIKSLPHDTGGVESSDLTQNDSNFVEPGIFQFEIDENSVIVEGGVFVFPAKE